MPVCPTQTKISYPEIHRVWDERTFLSAGLHHWDSHLSSKCSHL